MAVRLSANNVFEASLLFVSIGCLDNYMEMPVQCRCDAIFKRFLVFCFDIPNNGCIFVRETI